ncbi:MAG: TrkH family potassium uptake protein [Candidatus Scalindua sp. AMX11]|nr:MAG: TrkH family potassium uptake protein [Candidatus Scalindua sp.]NOG86097.1 TrkH family potassium uptake protein [Planctomycetota bacterium]RZV98864.1 MAG: TrkH family potassium uptake protein [Candidatus Scalindua sp. SCAELEC01]TDE66944.1 MAG: TrkH family potassium uptake protein [Candidatus Scalindua sp. AMX11]GJQ57751.1 MAG: Trk system potassium transporter TrkH [Candidatus Scalindua sp.]
MNIPLVLHTLGNLLIFFSCILLVPLGVSLVYGMEAEIWAFMSSILASAIMGVLFKGLFKSQSEDITIRESFAIVAFWWMSCAFFGALPYWLSGECTTFCDAYFESMSGLTTTGATIFSDVEILPHGILFWRSMSQWLGGMGIVVFFVAVLPAIGVGGHKLFSVEAPGPTTDKIKPRIAQTAKILWMIYLSLTAIVILLYWLGGMEIFDSICHAFATVSTGGFSTKNQSIEAFNSLFIEYVAIAFAFIAACNFILHYQCVTGQFKKITGNAEFRLFVSILLFVICCITLALFFFDSSSYNGGVKDAKYESLGGALRYAAFQVVSITTSTGFCNADFDQWPNCCRFFLILVMFIGGCAGSTAGGMKVARIMLLFKSSARELVHLLRPRAIMHVKLSGKPVSEEILTNTLGFVVLYLGIFGVFSIILTIFGTEPVTAFSAVASMMNNVGPALADAGASKTYGDIAYPCKWILIFSMLLGRLEIYTVVLIFLPITWKK